MFEYSGWVTIRESFDEAGEDDARLATIVADLEQKILLLADDNCEIGLRSFNGSPRLWFLGASNRPSSSWDGLVVFLHELARIAPGSYGLVHLRDDEKTGDDDYRVLVLCKGQLTFERDPFLSPFYPTVEER
jgi:hypothetical protein